MRRGLATGGKVAKAAERRAESSSESEDSATPRWWVAARRTWRGRFPVASSSERSSDIQEKRCARSRDEAGLSVRRRGGGLMKVVAPGGAGRVGVSRVGATALASKDRWLGLGGNGSRPRSNLDAIFSILLIS